MPSSSSSSSASTIPKLEYEVFLSFRGEDTRNNFTSHLYDALCQKKIKTFIDDELQRGDQISPSLSNAIEQSKISVIVFSKGYASSRWCLEELGKILECKKRYGQIVIPVFYRVDPSDVRKQSGAFGETLAKLEERFKNDSEMLLRWRAALSEAANLSGFDSNVIRSESILVQEVVKVILKRLNDDSPLIDNKNLVGVDSRIEYIEWLLCIGFAGVRKIGIWGMGGIGKTALAGVVFNKISRHFESSYFVKNIREESEKCKGLIELHQELICSILEDKDANIGSTFTIRRLRCKKVLIVFDDVTHLEQIESLIGDFNYLGSGSRIIITTRDKQVLKNCEVDHIYEIEILSDDAAFELFSQYAFRQNLPPKDYIKLSSKVVAYAKGVPLALKVLGSSLFKRTKKEWESSINRLNKISDMNIQKLLKVSYDGLNDEEQHVFLDIACFFKDYHRDRIEEILDACGFDSHIDINVLIERSLITVSSNTITMHDLLQDMGREIVRQESTSDPGQRSRLWHHEDIFSVLTNNTGTRAILSMRLHMSKVREIHLKPKAFKKMHNLRFLEVYGSEHDNKVHCFEDLESDFSELRYLCWYGYSANSLPQNFNPNNLVALYMSFSKVKQLWTTDQKLDKLKHIDLSYSKHLSRMPDLSLMPNLESLVLEGCTNLCDSFSSIHNLKKLVRLNLRECKNLNRLSISTHWKSLQKVILSNCSNLKTVSYIPCTVEVLYLDGTAIKELPPLEHLFRLVKFSLKNCSRLERIPESICELKSLKYLYLSGCSKLDRLPNGLGSLKALEELEIEGTAIREIPLSITCLNNLRTLSFARCRIQKPPNFLLFHLPVFRKLMKLNLADCCIEQLPNNLGKLSSLEQLNLGRNNFESLPVSIKDLSNLSRLDLSNCQRLKSLPELPHYLLDIQAQGCTSLEALSGLPTLCLSMLTGREIISFINCFKLKFQALPVLTEALLNIQRNADVWFLSNEAKEIIPPISCICFPGSEIPEWFSFKSSGYFIKLPTGWLSDNLIGFAFCTVVSFRDYQELGVYGLGFRLLVNEKVISSGYLFDYKGSEVIESDHVFVGYDYSIMSFELLTLSLDSEGCIEFFVEHSSENIKDFGNVKNCGVSLLYAKDNYITDARVDRDQRLNTISWSVDDCLGCCLDFCPRHDKMDDCERAFEILDRWSPYSAIYKRPMAYEHVNHLFSKYGIPLSRRSDCKRS